MDLDYESPPHGRRKSAGAVLIGYVGKVAVLVGAIAVISVVVIVASCSGPAD